jgi:hypothetical protein
VQVVVGDWDVSAWSAGAWTALAAWIVVAMAIAALLYAGRQLRWAKRRSGELLVPRVTMYMESSVGDRRLIDIVVKNFGQTSAYDIRFDLFSAASTPGYGNVDDDEPAGIAGLNVPAEIPFLAPSQEFRSGWDVPDRRRLEGPVKFRVEGSVTYYDRREETARRTGERRRHQTRVVLDTSILHPVARLELLSTHDLARQEKQKLELLRGVVTYLQHTTKETREDVLRAEINRMSEAAQMSQDRHHRPDAVTSAESAAQRGESARAGDELDTEVLVKVIDRRLEPLFLRNARRDGQRLMATPPVPQAWQLPGSDDPGGQSYWDGNGLTECRSAAPPATEPQAAVQPAAGADADKPAPTARSGGAHRAVEPTPTGSALPILRQVEPLNRDETVLARHALDLLVAQQPQRAPQL